MLPDSYFFLVWITHQTTRNRWHIPPKRWLTFSGLHDAIFQMIELLKHSSSFVQSHFFLYGFIALADLDCFFRFFQSGNPSTGDQPVARPLPTHRTQKQNKRKQTTMPRVEFEPMTPVLERAKMVHALDRAASVIGLCTIIWDYIVIMRVLKRRVNF
jgi:hypothetical protein